MKQDFPLLQTITIPRYITRIRVAKKRRATRFIRGRKTPKIPAKYKHLEYNEKGILVYEDGEKVIANSLSVGTPRYEAISGNRFTTGYDGYLRNNIVYALKEMYRPYVKSMRSFDLFPLIMEWDFYTTIGEANFDMSNFWFYLKYFEDTLIDEGLIPDDSVRYITGSAGPLFIPVRRFGQRKFVFRFYHDNREFMQELKPWKTPN